MTPSHEQDGACGGEAGITRRAAIGAARNRSACGRAHPLDESPIRRAMMRREVESIDVLCQVCRKGVCVWGVPYLVVSSWVVPECRAARLCHGGSSSRWRSHAVTSARLSSEIVCPMEYSRYVRATGREESRSRAARPW